MHVLVRLRVYTSRTRGVCLSYLTETEAQGHGGCLSITHESNYAGFTGSCERVMDVKEGRKSEE